MQVSTDKQMRAFRLAHYASQDPQFPPAARAKFREIAAVIFAGAGRPDYFEDRREIPCESCGMTRVAVLDESTHLSIEDPICCEVSA